MLRAVILTIALAVPAAARLPRDTPYCAAKGTTPLFLSAMGEPFRAAPGGPYPVARWFAGADLDRDGAIDRSEFLADAGRFFAALDRNRDGRLTPDEIIAYETNIAPEIALYAPRARDPQPPGSGSGYGGAMGAGRFAWLNIPEPVASADADVDRVVDRAEFLAAAGRRFDSLNGKDKGRLTLAHLPRTPQQIALEGPCRSRPKPRDPDRDDSDRTRTPVR